jgi:hypothetical protein
MPVVETDPVMIRVWKGDDNDVFALFPTIPAHDHYVTSYQRVGQHAAADYGLCIRNSRPATETEAAPLLAELRAIGYIPRLIKRAGWKVRKQAREG